MSRFALITLSLAAVFTAGCQQNQAVDTTPAPVAVSEPPVTRVATPKPPPREVAEPVQAYNVLDTKIIYFEFDRSDIRREDRETVSAHASWLADNSNLRVRLEGHADERGSREYNIGLGERRAQAVRQALMLQGVSGSQIETLSYGEERPATRGSGEFSWQQNRRVEIVYLP